MTAETGMGDMPPLDPIEDDGESETVIDQPEEGDEPADGSDTPDDEE